MDELRQIFPTSRCFSCLSGVEEKRLQIHCIQKQSLKTILKLDQLILCYICKKMAERVEGFIHNVETAQTLLNNNIECANDDIFMTVKSLVRSPWDLATQLLNSENVIEIKGSNPEDEGKVKIEYDNYLDQLPDFSVMDMAYVKEEHDMKLSDSMILLKSGSDNEQSDGDNLEIFINNLKNKYAVKKEKKNDLLELPKKEYKSRRKKLERGHNKVKKINEDVDHIVIKDSVEISADIESKIETVHLTNQQCVEERDQKKMDRLYLELEYKCVDCIKGFSFKPSYEKHMEKHSKRSGDYECDVCKLRLVSEHRLNIHRKCHTVRYRCAVCHLTRVCRESIVDHISTNHSLALLQFHCPKCDKGFARKTSLRKHMYYGHKDKLECVYCNKFYATKESVKAHISRRHPSEVSTSKPVKKYPCKECGMAFESPSRLKTHAVKHSHTRNYYCVECDKSFKTHFSLQQHLKTVSVHVTNEDLKYPCSVCNKRFTTKGHADRHLNDVHIKTARFYCDQCGKEFKCKYKLADHLRAHEGYVKPRKFFCTVCNKGFHTKRNLDGHLRIHTGEKPFLCPECPAQFNQYGSLYNHKKLVHKLVGRHSIQATNTLELNAKIRKKREVVDST